MSKQFVKYLDNPKFMIGKSDSALNAMTLNENYSDPVIKLSIEIAYQGHNYLLSQKLFVTSVSEISLINDINQESISFKFINFIEFSNVENPLIIVIDFGHNLGIDINWSTILDFLDDFQTESAFSQYMPRLVEELSLKEQNDQLNHLVDN